jgi:photosynthetic reaction center cytochrome c subunit
MSNPIKSGLIYGIVLVGVPAGILFAVTNLNRMQHPPIVGVQRGFRGTGLDQIYNPRALAELAVQAKIPYILPAADPTGDKASEEYDNVRVLKNLSVGQFTRLMASIATWVAPSVGCAYCHNGDNMALDDHYTKVVARRMMQMTQYINTNWKAHVKNTGVTCYTCHGGNPVPKYIWYNNPGPKEAVGFAETRQGMTHPNPMADYSALPWDPLTPFLEQSNNIRVQSTTALAEDNMSSIKQTEWTYSLMLTMSKSLGVNCDYCHNTRAFRDWSQSTPARVTAWYGIRMVRDLNNNYLDPLRNVFPAARKGPLGDSPKVYCATCHQGIYKPLYGVSMLAKFKVELGGPPLTTAPLMAPYVPPPDVPQPAAGQPPEAPPPSPPPAAPKK